MTYKLKRRLKRIYRLSCLGRIYHKLETWTELQICYNYTEKMKCMRWDPFGKSVVELLDCDQAKKILNSLSKIKNNDISYTPSKPRGQQKKA